MTSPRAFKLGLVGGRGYVGRELVALLASHPGLELAFATSSTEAGKPVAAALPGAPASLVFEAPRPELALREELGLDAVVLALPNHESAPWVAALQALGPRRAPAVLDLSADHRFDDAWVYGQPERLRAELAGARRVANPGCYATAAQLALWPLLPRITGEVHVFGVSGYSGAGSSPSPKNDPERLRENLLPYSLVDHVHEHEVTRQLAHPVRLLPHVAPWFRGITVTASFALREPVTRGELEDRLREAYAREPLVTVTRDAPLVRDVAGHHDVRIGGVEVSRGGTRGAVVATIDNLLGGAATQALRCLNLMLGLPERAGLELER